MYFESFIVTYLISQIIVFLYDFSSALIFFRSKFFYIDNIIEKVVCPGFYIYIFDFITHSCNVFINIKLFLIHYLYSKIVITVLLNILLNNNKY